MPCKHFSGFFDEYNILFEQHLFEIEFFVNVFLFLFFNSIHPRRIKMLISLNGPKCLKLWTVVQDPNLLL